jgi:hypothetical protein
MSELPFKLRFGHKPKTKYQWRIYGILFLNQEEFELWYNRYIISSNCELCDKKYKTSSDRHLDHNHDTHEPRNIVCNRCNTLKSDTKLSKNNKLKEKYIYFSKSQDRYVFEIKKDTKRLVCKKSKNLEFLKNFRDDWLLNNEHNS